MKRDSGAPKISQAKRDSGAPKISQATADTWVLAASWRTWLLSVVIRGSISGGV